ncbi:MAG: hypothetical protein ACTSQS_18320 [Promethearchaeota archaeon]
MGKYSISSLINLYIEGIFKIGMDGYGECELIIAVNNVEITKGIHAGLINVYDEEKGWEKDFFWEGL